MFVLSLFTMSVGEVRASEIALDRFAKLALACVHKEYPNHISHSLRSDDDVAPPRELTPAFYGCLDWTRPCWRPKAFRNRGSTRACAVT